MSSHFHRARWLVIGIFLEVETVKRSVEVAFRTEVSRARQVQLQVGRGRHKPKVSSVTTELIVCAGRESSRRNTIRDP